LPLFPTTCKHSVLTFTMPFCLFRSTEEEDERAWNPHYAARKAHNDAMRNEAGQRDAIRAMFLKVSVKTATGWDGTVISFICWIG
jgi:hypothetical protein